MWSFGCIVAEISTRSRIFPSPPDVTRYRQEPPGDNRNARDRPKQQIARLTPLLAPCVRNRAAADQHKRRTDAIKARRDILQEQIKILGPPEKDVLDWLQSLPAFSSILGGTAFFDVQQSFVPASLLVKDDPSKLLHLRHSLLRWAPRERVSAASARRHVFLAPPSLNVVVSEVDGRNGRGTIAEGCLDEDVLRYLQGCPSWPEYAAADNSANCVNPAEVRKGLKKEFAGYTDAQNPPVCTSLNSDPNLPLINSKRVAKFCKALRKKLQPWLDQLTWRWRDALNRSSLPPNFMGTNGKVFLSEEFRNNAFAYASIQFMRNGAREDGWHTDGGTSLLHAALTLFGSRTVEVDTPSGCRSLAQEPGSFYIGNLCALRHNVRHNEDDAGCFEFKAPNEAEATQWQIAVMIRADIFREGRARTLNTTPGPTELYNIVNDEIAKHLAEVPLHLPELADVIMA